jgi:NAD(P)-dependent dehydrogenase (short-subunit alcohol dehydrogenase family)
MSVANGKVALVTGGARRVGRAIALELARRGYALAVHHHQSPPDEVEQTLADCRAMGVHAEALRADLAQPAAIAGMFLDMETRFRRLDVLVNSASVFQRRRLMDISLDDWQQTMAVNLSAPFLCTQEAVRLMRAQTSPGGVIINIGDRGALEPWPDYAHHGVSKAGLLALTRLTAASETPLIRANMVIPGLVMKPEEMTDARWQALAADTPAGRPGSADDVARAVVFLAEEPFITGAVLRVDGGAGLG